MGRINSAPDSFHRIRLGADIFFTEVSIMLGISSLVFLPVRFSLKVSLGLSGSSSTSSCAASIPQDFAKPIAA